MKSKGKLVASILVFFSTPLVSIRSWADDPITAGTANIGSLSGNTTFPGFWATGQGGFNGYMLTGDTGGTATFINVPSSGGTIYFRANNTGPLFTNAGNSLAFLDSGGNLFTGGQVTAGGAPNTIYGGMVAGVSSGTLAGVIALNTAATSGGSGLRADSTSGVGVYVTSGSNYAIQATSASSNAVFAHSQSSSAAAVYGVAASTSSLSFQGNGGITIGGSAAKPGGGMWSMTSDERVKKDVAAFKQGLDDLEKVHVVTFRYNGLGGTEDNGKVYVGVIAQDLETILPRMVGNKKAKLRADDARETAIKEVDPSDFTYLLINSVQTLSAEVKDLKARDQDLQLRIKELRAEESRLCSAVKTVSRSRSVIIGKAD
jgi:hypothetical protein